MEQSPVYDWKARITLPYTDCSGIIQLWFDRCSKAICYEHEADDEIKKTHIHLALIGCNCQEEALKRMWKNAPGKGNSFWSVTPCDDPDRYLTYMSKGKLRPKSIKLFSEDQVESSRLAWVDPVKDDKTRTDPTNFMINKVLETINYDTFLSYKNHYRATKLSQCNTVFHSNEDYCIFLLSEVRSATMKVYWGVNQRVPHASQYKIVAGSVFMRLCEKFGIFESGITALKDLWY